MENLQPGRRPADTMGFQGDRATFEYLLQGLSRIRLKSDIDLDGCPPRFAAIIREIHIMATRTLEYVHQSSRMQYYQPSGHNEGPPPGARYNEIRCQRTVPPGRQGGRRPRRTKPTPNTSFSQARSSHASLAHGGPSDGSVPHIQYDVNDEAGDDVEEDLPEGVWHDDVPVSTHMAVPRRTRIRPPPLRIRGKL